MSITATAIRSNRVTAVLLAVLLVSGISAYLAMPQKMDPGFIIRTAMVVTQFPGASPDRVEMLVTDPIEQAVQSIPELDFVSSTSRTGVSIVNVNIREQFSDVRPIWDSLRRKIEAIEGELPSGIRGPTINDELGDIYPIMFSMTADGFSNREMTEIGETIRDQLLHIDGVGRVDIQGDQEERVYVEFNNAQLLRLGLSPVALQQILASRNIIVPGGQIDIGSERIALEPSGNFSSVEELGRTLIELPTGGVAYLGDVTTIRRGYREPTQGLVTVNGQRALTFAVNVADDSNLVEIGSEIRDFFEVLPARYPHGIDFELTYFQPQDVEKKVDEFVVSVLQAIGIVLVVMLLFLGMRTGLVVSSLIPMAMVITIWVLSLVGESIHQMSLAALIIALGLLVDNAIVVSEAILVRMNKGEKGVDAAVNACAELRVPLLVSSLTTSAAFLPIYLAESAVGEYTGALFTVVTITLLISWVLSITVIPLFCVLFLKPKDEEETFNGGVYRAYRASLGVFLKRRWVSLGVVLAVFIASLQLWSLVPAIFFPSQESPFFMAGIELPVGTRIENTQEMSAEVDRWLQERRVDIPDPDSEIEEQGITSWTTFIGETPVPFTLGFSPSPSLGGYSERMVHATSTEAALGAMDELRDFVAGRFPDASTNIRMLSAGPPAGDPVQIRLSGPNTEELFELVEQVQGQLRDISGTRDIDDNWGPRVKKLVVRIDEERARRAGITNQEAALALQTFLTGLESTRYREEDESIPVIIRSVAADRHDLERVRSLAVFSQSRRSSVPLSQIADIDLAFEASAVLRRDRYRTVTVSADVDETTTAIAVVQAIQPWLDEQSATWDVGVRYELGGEMESSVKANASIGDKMPIALLIIILLLVMQFNSIRKSTIVLSTIVLAMIGVVVGLVVMGSSFGFMTLLGIVSLAGIVINNAIVLLDRIQLELDASPDDPLEAIINASQQRVRPILLTTATTVASLIPLYISGGAMWQPMAVAIMFGLMFATMLTLMVVPLLYAMLYRVEAKA
ncbi:MAG: multidrug efflux pump [Polyangiales bacterium]|jgi:multidrug efflux pump